MSDEKIWERNVRESFAAQIRTLELQRNRMSDMLKSMDQNIEALKKRAENLQVRRHDPVVIYASRTGGPAPTYHDAENTCGRGLRIEHPRRVLLGDAIERRIRACAFCGPRATLQDTA